MRRRLAVGGVLAALLVSILAAMPGASAAQSGSAGNYIVVLKSTASSPATLASQHASRYGARVGHVYRHALKGYSATLSSTRLAALRADPNVAAVVADLPVHAFAQTLPTGINRIDGELSSTVSGNGSGAVNVDIAIIDTGIGPNTDLNIVGGTNCVGGSSFNDDNGHGTHVAGTAAARDNADGVVGVAPGARLYAVKVLNAAGSGTTSQIICGIDWVTARASTIEVANMSLGGQSFFGSFSGCSSSFDPMHGAICRSVSAGVTYAVAAGNSAANANNFVPATYSEVITVSALADFNGQPGGGAAATCRADTDDTFANFSNFGADIDLIAPGVCILSSAPGGGLATFSGTSMASPHVAGAAALYKSTHASATPAQVKSALQAAGNLNWNNADDPDPTKERLLNVDAF
ncbi:MAG TPA: S8 family serine peptidase [Actinomycetota bacterium]|nr:S8 family serine peptidase [Actinomycetota bacterium]